MFDPLGAFLHEKVAAEAPSTKGAPRPFTKDPDPQSHDPGERAFAAMMAASGGALIAKIGPMLANAGLRMLSNHGVSDWPGSLPAGNVKNIAGLMEEGEMPSGKLMGLWNVTSRAHRDRTGGAALAEAAEKMQGMQHVVDSFIDKHQLAEKGVRLNMHQGPLSFLEGNRYDPLTKQVFTPNISKEQILHELGHAADATGSRLGRARNLLDPIIRRGVTVALPLALIAGDAIKDKIPGTIDDKAIGFMQDHAPAIMGATLAATHLYPEAKASYLAYQHIAKTEGPHAARQALKKFIPMWGTYLLGAVPAVVGMALARKYMRHARDEKAQQTKVAGLVGDLGGALKGVGHTALDFGGDALHIGKQVGGQTLSMLSEPGFAKRISGAAREVGTSPEFVYGALSAALPAAIGSLYLYGTPAGKELRARIHPDHHDQFALVNHKIPGISKVNESWREANPGRFAGLVAAGAALSGGIIAKFLSDLQRVL